VAESYVVSHSVLFFLARGDVLFLLSAIEVLFAPSQVTVQGEKPKKKKTHLPMRTAPAALTPHLLLRAAASNAAFGKHTTCGYED
jgi:hypothetical protein